MAEFIESLNHLTAWGLFAFVVMCAGVQLALSGLRGIFLLFKRKGE